MRPTMALFAAAVFFTAPLTGLAQSAAGTGSFPAPGASVPAPPASVPAPPSPQGRQGADLSFGVAVLQGLDKVTARIVTIEAPVGTPVRFGSLEIVARACKKRPPEDLPESAAFIDVWELRPGEPTAELFRGWMFASSPAVSAMEHPVYDIWVLDCQGTLGR